MKSLCRVSSTGSTEKKTRADWQEKVAGEQLERVCVYLLPCYSINGELANKADRADPLGWPERPFRARLRFAFRFAGQLPWSEVRATVSQDANASVCEESWKRNAEEWSLRVVKVQCEEQCEDQCEEQFRERERLTSEQPYKVAINCFLERNELCRPSPAVCLMMVCPLTRWPFAFNALKLRLSIWRLSIYEDSMDSMLTELLVSGLVKKESQRRPIISVTVRRFF